MLSSTRTLAAYVVSALLISSTAAIPSINATFYGLSIRDDLTFNPVGLNLQPVNVEPTGVARRMTNGQRLARGLPLNKPRFRRAGQLRARTSPTPTSDTPVTTTAEPSTVTVTIDPTSDTPTSEPVSSSTPESSTEAPSSSTPTPSCTVRNGVVLADVSGSQGYISKDLNTFGEFQFTTAAADALTVAVDSCNPQDLELVNVASSYKFLGGIVGFASTSGDLKVGTTNYAYLGATSQTSLYSPPANSGNAFSDATGTPENVESAIFVVDDTTGVAGVITPKWVNSDSTLAVSTVVYVPSAGAFALVGDVSAFQSKFGAIESTTLTVLFDQAASAAPTTV
ncbi:hypothetical protein PHLCEN_2v3954 [Hermanssonia centrifuga]|uniref:Uncharacterized protein n=1 Tax=Hermanssonia centrifuga TaxID=98765 RepID=A0A2R6Q7K2_9APHY|nr:hypothetical protein PHLCEN_2v3954 [Hermanssonia centrifuga]